MPIKINVSMSEDLHGQYAHDLRIYVQQKIRSIRPGQDIDVEDVVQEAFLRMSSLKNPESIDNPKGYVFRVAKNLIIDIGRRRSAQPIEVSSSRVNDDGGPPNKSEGTNLNPERYVSGQEELAIITRAIGELPENCRNVFCMQRKTGLTYAKIAVMLDISESMVQKHMAHALFALHKALP